MTISFPITPPSNPKPSRLEFCPLTTCAVSKSPYTGHQQVVEWDGGLWSLDVTYPAMLRAEAAPLIAFLESLRGRRGTFLVGPTLFATPLGAGGGTPKVKGAAQVGYTLATDGWPNSTLVLKAGDLFQINNQLYRNLTDATSSGAGEVTLDIWPNARNHADNSDLDLTSPVCVMRLVQDDVISHIEIIDHWYSIAFSAIEAK